MLEATYSEAACREEEDEAVTFLYEDTCHYCLFLQQDVE